MALSLNEIKDRALKFSKGLVTQTYGKFSDHLMQVSHGQ